MRLSVGTGIGPFRVSTGVSTRGSGRAFVSLIRFGIWLYAIAFAALGVILAYLALGVLWLVPPSRPWASRTGSYFWRWLTAGKRGRRRMAAQRARAYR